jgi:hypothetical protein
MNKIKKYIGAGILVAASMLGGCGDKDYVLPPTKVTSHTEIQALQEDCYKHYRSSLEDNKYTLKEQKETFEKLENIIDAYQQVSSFMPLDLQGLHTALDDNLNGVDFGTPDFQGTLNVSNRKMYVENCISCSEFGWGLLTIAIAGITLSYIMRE